MQLHPASIGSVPPCPHWNVQYLQPVFDFICVTYESMMQLVHLLVSDGILLVYCPIFRLLSANFVLARCRAHWPSLIAEIPCFT